MYTPDFWGLFVRLVPGDTLMKLRLASKGYNGAADEFIDEGVRSSKFLLHGGKSDRCFLSESKKKKKCKPVTRVLFLLNVTEVGSCACCLAFNLSVLDTPEGVKSIGKGAFHDCRNLTRVSFSGTLMFIGGGAFADCGGLENVDLHHTNLQEIGIQAFTRCLKLKSMTIPDSLQTLSEEVFFACSKLVPSNVDVRDWQNDTTSEVGAHLRSLQSSFKKAPPSAFFIIKKFFACINFINPSS
ncbi:hypothetical protein TL16_g03410 [Triparma laevis f. inornata]|uniref:Uncharacterized protein n=2 Tax=Triparma laevis TaxID=1534972 RepID=A0A9W7F1P2_9STRA|nr:hypothetical protein TL16_g03410 [Triparma laevis f. inornata]GMH99843.1 hypothetical protein TrLO_g749 [Triparma laevis f. longispina]